MFEREIAREISVTAAGSAEDIVQVRELFVEYQEWLDVDLCFQDFDTELATLPGKYAPPQGGLWLARVDGKLAGCIGFRPHDGAACEMKRLWIRPAFRGRGLGRRLAELCIVAARDAGHRTMCLDTFGYMDEALALYASLGFHEIPAYYDNPHEDVRYLELDLTGPAMPAGRASRT